MFEAFIYIAGMCAGYFIGKLVSDKRNTKLIERNKVLANKCRRLEHSNSAYYGPKHKKLIEEAT